MSAITPSHRTDRSLILTMLCLQWHPATAHIDPSFSQCRVCNGTQPPHRSISHPHNVVSAMTPSHHTDRPLILTMSCLQWHPAPAQIDLSSSQCRVCNGTQPPHRSIPHPHNVVSAMTPSHRTDRSLILTMSCLQWHPATAQIDLSSSQCRVCNGTQPPHRSIPHPHNVVFSSSLPEM